MIKCGALLDGYLQYLPHLNELILDENYITNGDVRQCLLNVSLEKKNLESALSCECGVSCKEMNIKHKHITEEKLSKIEDDNEDPTYDRHFQFSYDSNTYTEIKEIPAYPATKFVTDIGGWLGLFSGISFLSIVEILLFILLSALTIVTRLRHAIQIRRGRRHVLPPVLNL